MKRQLNFTALIMGFLLLGGAVWGQLTAVTKSPSGQLNAYRGSDSVTVAFDRPVVSLGDVSQYGAADCPLVISPKVEGTCRWVGTQVVSFTPADAYKKATRYSVSLKAGLTSEVDGSKLNKSVNWTFDTQRLAVAHTKPYNNERWMSLYPRVIIAFNMPVNTSVLKRNADFKQGTVKIPFDVEPISQEMYKELYKYNEIPRENIAVITADDRLQEGRAYTITLKKALTPKEGTLGMLSDYVFTFNTVEKFNIVLPVKEQCMPFMPSLRFTNPVRAEDIYKNISFTPDIKITSDGQEDASTGWSVKNDAKSPAYVYEVPLKNISFEPSKDYEVKINGALTDIFGNSLGRDVTFTWSNKGFCPSVKFKGGFGVLESYLKPYHPISAVNAGEIEVEKKKIRYQDFIPLYNSDDSGYCQKSNIEGNFIESSFNPNIERDVPVNTYLDLTPALEGSSGGIVFTQFKNKHLKTYSSKECWQSSVDNVTNMGITLKTSPDDILIWASSLKDGSPAKNKEVELRDVQNNVVWQGKTDRNGIAMAPGWAKLDFYRKDTWRSPEVWAFVKDGDNVSLISNHWNDGIQPWRFNISYDWNTEAKKYKNFIFTERDIYRPGETVYIKSILRSFKDGMLAMSGLSSADLIIKDSRGREVLNKQVDIDAKTSSFSYEYPVDQNAPTGTWSISVKSDNVFFYSYFRVEAVKPAEFSVELTPLAKEYYPAQKAGFTLYAKYMFGAALANAKVRWDAQLAPSYFEPEGYSDYSFHSVSNAENKTLLSSSDNLDVKGSASASVELPEIDYIASLYMQAGVLSPQNQELFARKNVMVFPAAVLAGIKATDGMVEAGKPYKAQIVTITPQGEIADGTKVDVSIVRSDYVSARKTGVSGRLEWVSEERKENIKDFKFISADGKIDFEFTPSRPGRYMLTASAFDNEGRKSVSSVNFYVYAQGQAYWKQSDDDILELVTDKKQYDIGSRAKVLVKSPYAKAKALVTVERDGILYSRVETIKGGSDYVSIPIEENFAPNAFVSIVLIQGRSKDNNFSETGEDLGKPQAKFGYTVLKVSPKENNIITSVFTDKKEYRPGDNVTITVKTQDYKGKAMPSDITVFAVDEAVLALTDFKTPDIFNYFYSDTLLNVETADSRLFIIGQRSFGQKGENRGGGGSGEGKLGGADLRSNFKFTPFYSASTYTGPGGTSEFSFKLPDNLTKFRVMAVSATEREFGSGENVLEVSKPVALKPLLPRFARAGDEFDCGFVVFNHTSADKLDISLTSAVTGAVSIIKPGQTKVTVPSGGSAVINSRCKANYFGGAEFKFSASSSKGSDGLQLSVPVLEVEQLQFLRVASSTQAQAKEKVVKPLNIANSKNNMLDVSFASTAMLDVKGALEYLSKYPFNCLEQRLSKLLPLLTGDDFFTAFNVANVKEYKEAAAKIIADIPLYQAPNGAFAYWTYPGYGDAFVSAYAIDVLTLASQNGYTVDKSVVKKGAKWLNNYLSNPREAKAYQYSVRETDISKAYAVYALTLTNTNAGAHFNNIFNARATIPLQAKVYLLKAAKNLKLNRQYNILYEEIMNNAKYTNTTMFFNETGGDMWIFSSDIYLTASVLEAVLNTKGAFEGDSKMAAWLTSRLNRQGHWGNTKNNAAAFRALNAYFKVKESTEPDFKVLFKIDSNVIFENNFKGRRNTKTQTNTLSFDELFKTKDDAMLEVDKQGEGLVYYNIALKYYPADYSSALNSGFKIEKTIEPLYPELGALAAGHRAVVTLKVTSNENRSFVALEDFLPAGFDIIDTTLATEGSFDWQKALEDSCVSCSFSRVERYDDRISAFADYLPKGVHTFKYIISASNSGEYSVPSAWVSLMYEPEFFGRTASSDITVK